MLVGRDLELAELGAHLANRRPVVVVGEAGVGKTTALRSAAAATGKRIFEGGGLFTLSWMEYLPLRRAICGPMAAADTQLAADIRAAVGTAPPADPAAGTETRLAADAHAVAAHVLRVVGGGVLLLDDLHWADPMTIDAVTMLAGHCSLLTAVRRGDPRTNNVLDSLLGAGLVQVDIDPLGQAEATELVHHLRSDLPDNTVGHLVRRSGGNPMFLAELARAPEMSTSLRLLLGARLRMLDANGRHAFGLLALAGRPLRAALLGEAGVKSLLETDLAVVEPDGLSARHALLAEAAADLFEPAEREELHAELARAASDAGEAARHYLQAGETDSALRAALLAAEQAERPGELASHLAVAASAANGAAADDLRMRAASALDEAHDWDRVTSVLDQVTSEDPEIRARGLLLRARGAWAAGDAETLRAALTDGLALVGGTRSETEVRLRIEQSRLPIFVDFDLPEGVRMTQAAFRLARATGVDAPRAEYLLGTALAVADQPGGGEHLQAAIFAAREAGDVHTEFLAANNLISFHESGGSPAAAREIAEEMIGRAAARGLGYWESAMRSTVVNLDVHAGRYTQVVGAAEELLDEPLEARTRDSLVECLGLALIDTGRVEYAIRRVGAAQGDAAADYKGRGQMLWVLAEGHLWSGRPARALRLLEDFLDGPADDPNLWFGRVTRAWALVELGRDPGPAAPPHERPMLLGIPPETEGLRLLHEGENAAAAGHFRSAAELWAPYHKRGQLRSAWAAGEALRRTGDLTAAVAQLEAAEALAEQSEAALFLARIHRSLRAAGRRRSAPRSIRRGGLTDRERQVLDLVQAGLTNAQIATQLGITRRTVVALVTSASVELGAANRSQAAALAARE
jgi:DNA-binding CsgD family transcriptional regulator